MHIIISHSNTAHYKKIKQFDEIKLNRRMYSDSVVYGKPLYVFLRMNCFCVQNSDASNNDR